MASNPDAVIFPSLPDGTTDPALRVETHSYDPWAFCGMATQPTWGTPTDVKFVMDM